MAAKGCRHIRLASWVALFILCQPALRADIPLPPRILDPLSAEEAWNVIRLTTANVEKLLQEKRPREIVDQIPLCSPALRILARSSIAPERQPLLDAQIARAFRSVNVIASESMADNQGGVESAFAELRKVLAEVALGYDAAIVHGEVYHCRDHPEMVSTNAAESCQKCAQKLIPRRIPYSFIDARPDKPSMKLSAHPASPLEAGREAAVTVRLQTLDGKPVVPSDLLITHGAPVHMLIIGPALSDFQHAVPSPTATAGEYAFTFTPAMGGTYRVHAAVVPAATALQEYPVAEVPCAGAAAPKPDLTESYAAGAAGLQFKLSFPIGRNQPPRAGQIQMLRIDVADAEGRPVKRLEPIMNAFAHLAGFYADDATVLQLHPVGGDILREDLRGGPSLGFKFYPPKPGFIRFHCEVRVDGKRMMVPFGVKVLP